MIASTKRVHDTDQGDLRTLGDIEQPGDGSIASPGADVRRTGWEDDFFGQRREMVRLDGGQVGIQGGDPHRQGAVGNQLVQRQT